jgi:hypothetical protein
MMIMFFVKILIWKLNLILDEKTVLTLNQIEPTGPGIFNFPVKDFGRTPKEFKYDEFIKYEVSIKKKK